MLKNQTSTIWETISKQTKSKPAVRYGQMHNKMQKGPSFGKVNDLQLPIFACKLHGSYSPTVPKEASSEYREKWA
jgi:hypothetical protein